MCLKFRLHVNIVRSFTFLKMFCKIPVHNSPSPEKPTLHLQLNEPLVFVQFAFPSQVWDPSEHSSMSAIIKIKLKYALVQKVFQSFCLGHTTRIIHRCY